MWVFEDFSDAFTYLYSSGAFRTAVAIGSAVASALVLKNRLLDHERKDSNQVYSVELNNEPGVYVNPQIKNGNLLRSFHGKIRTLYDGFFNGMKIANEAGDSRLFGTRYSNTYKWLTYAEVLQKVKNVGNALIKMGIHPGQNTRIGIFSINCAEWMMVSIASYFQSMVVVPINVYMDDAGIMHIIKQCSLSVIFAKGEAEVKKLLSFCGECASISIVVSFDMIDLKSIASVPSVKLFSFSDFQEIGKQIDVPPNPPKPEDIVNICYTSGSTGIPKGVLISHSNVLASLSSFYDFYKGMAAAGKEIMISYLPLAHIFEFVAENIFVCQGYKIGYYAGNVKMFMDDIKLLRPTFMPAVPKILNTIHDRIKATLHSSGFLKKAIFNYAFKKKSEFMETSVGKIYHYIYDSLVFYSIQKQLGGKLKMILVGGSACVPEVLKFMKVVLGCHVLEGYGQTETTGGTICQLPGDFTVGNVGSPIKSIKLKIVPAPEFVDLTGEVGELYVKGVNVFKGYFGESANEAFDSNGWFPTGDIVRRNKGEYIVPSKVENAYLMSPYVTQCFVFGYAHESYCVAIVVPDEKSVLKTAKKLNLDGNYSNLCSLPEIRNVIHEDMDRVASECSLNGIEKVRKIHLYPHMFSTENGLLTATSKVKRHFAARFFANDLKKLYAEDNC